MATEKRKVLWKVGVYGDGGPLGSDDIANLSRDFDFTAQQLAELSAALTPVMCPYYQPLGVIEPMERAAKGKKIRIASLDRAKHIHNSFCKLRAQLTDIGLGDPTEAASKNDQQACLSKWLQDIEAGLGGIEAFLEHSIKRDDPVFYRDVANRRRIRDERRSAVCSATFRLWEADGRKLTYSTDFDTGLRSGKLFVFVNAVVACLTSPSAKISGQTLVSEIKYYKKWTKIFQSLHNELRSGH